MAGATTRPAATLLAAVALLLAASACTRGGGDPGEYLSCSSRLVYESTHYVTVDDTTNVQVRAPIGSGTLLGCAGRNGTVASSDEKVVVYGMTEAPADQMVAVRDGDGYAIYADDSLGPADVCHLLDVDGCASTPTGASTSG